MRRPRRLEGGTRTTHVAAHPAGMQADHGDAVGPQRPGIASSVTMLSAAFDAVYDDIAADSLGDLDRTDL